jgi:UDP-2,3-diacylglucosamine hydrolase
MADLKRVSTFSRAYFFSDLHLHSSDQRETQTLLKFLRNLKSTADCSHLFMVGDIFDLWIADHEYFINQFRPLINEIKRLKSLGVEIHYFEGNHDLYLKKFWQDDLGIEVHAQASYFQLGSWNLRVEHGDQMDPEDKGYLFLRWFLRTPFMVGLAHHLPGSWVALIGKWASHKSRHYTTHIKVTNTERNHQVIRAHAETNYAEKRFDYIISGHLHSRLDFKGPGYQVINLGSWFEPPQVFALEKGGHRWQFLVENDLHLD